MIFRLDERIIFPDPGLAEPDGLLAVGGDLSVERLLLAYRNGIFPWYGDDSPILWYAPHERYVIFPTEVKISKSMRKIIRLNTFTITENTCFDKIIEACSSANREGQPGTWITPEMKYAYQQLHVLGAAHSVEVWLDNELAGGLYGVAVGRVFCGESMFSRVSNASKTALIWLCQCNKYQMIDCQFSTSHLESMGARSIGRGDYMKILNRSLLS